MKKIILILLIGLAGPQAIAQQCGFTNRSMILLDITDIETGNKISNLSIALCDKNGNAIVDYIYNCNDDKSDGVTYLDSFVFWENNKPPKQKFKNCADQYIRQSFAGADNHYICVVPSRLSSNILLKAKRNLIAENINTSTTDFCMYVKLSGKNITEQIIKIPSNAIYDICECHLYSYHKMCNIQPLQIVVQNGKASVNDKRFGVVPIYINKQVVNENSLDREENNYLYQVHLVDELSEKIVQSLPIKKDRFKDKIISNTKHIKVFDFYKTFDDYPCIMVPAIFKNNALKTNLEEEESYIIYSFDTSAKRYAIDTLLSSMDYINVKNDIINTSFNGVFGSNVVATSTAYTYSYYKFLDNKWEFISTENIPIQLPKSPVVKVNIPGEPNCIFYEKFKTKAMQYFDAGIESITITDTFYIYNGGTASAKLKKTYGDYFTIPPIINAGEKLPVYYKRIFLKSKQSVYMDMQIPYQENVMIDFDSNKTINAVLQYTFINALATQKVLADSTKRFYLKTNEYELNEIQLDAKDNLVAFGKKLIADSTLVGIWNYTDVATKNTSQKQYKKLLRLLINPEPLMSNCNIKFINKNGSITYHNHLSGRNLNTFITDSIVRVEITADSAFGSYEIDFAKLQNNDFAIVYLLKPSNLFYYNGKLKVPFNFNPTQYYIHYNNDGKSLKKDFLYLQALQSNFSKIQIIKASRYNQLDYLDLVNCTKAEKNNILNYLKTDSKINYVAQLWESARPVYCDNRIYIYKEYKTISKELLEQAEKLGFEFMQAEYGSSEISTIFKYNNILLDTTFIDNYNKIVTLFDYQKSHINVHAQMVEESMKK